eukprot:m.29584 g.29584  ORF g.29584 m.29584 type:complete len:397 (-) comp6717_c0_seq1:2761-3951(-)
MWAKALFLGLNTALLISDTSGKVDWDALPKCPENTFVRYGRNERHHVHCVCPNTHVCEGCGEGCTEEKAILKKRCVFGFKPSCGDGCRCAKIKDGIGGFNRTVLGEMHDLRLEPFCPGPIEKYTKTKSKFVFIVSNGHTGTTYLGQPSSWRRMFGGSIIEDLFVTHEMEANKSVVRQMGWHDDYCEKSLAYVRDIKVPQMESVLAATERGTWLGAGHQIILGMVPALVRVLGDKAKFIRLRRNKKDVAYSYYQKGGDPCTGKCIYCICPLDAAARIPVRGEIWEKLSVYQRYLWFVDELEAQWQATKKTFPNINFVEIDWDKQLSTKTFQRIAKFTGFPAFEPKISDSNITKSNHHVFGAKNETWMQEQIEGYKNIIGLKSCTKYSCLPPLDTPTP